MLRMLLLGLLLVCVTTIVQAMFMVSGIRFLLWRLARGARLRRPLTRAIVISSFTAWMFLGMVVQALVWALFYLQHPAITELPNLETALYFSLVTFASVGYGDVVLHGDWRVLAALEGTNGVIVFGWTTALIFWVVQKIYGRE